MGFSIAAAGWTDESGDFPLRNVHVDVEQSLLLAVWLFIGGRIRQNKLSSRLFFWSVSFPVVMTGSGFGFLNFRVFWAILETAVTLVLWTFAFFYWLAEFLFSPQRWIRKSSMNLLKQITCYGSTQMMMTTSRKRANQHNRDAPVAARGVFSWCFLLEADLLAGYRPNAQPLVHRLISGRHTAVGHLANAGQQPAFVSQK